MAKAKNVEDIKLDSDNNLEDSISVKGHVEDLPTVNADFSDKVEDTVVERRVKVKLIKDLPRIFIINDFYSGLRGETLLVPESVAYILKGSDNTTDVFAV